jgi:sialidase-1
VGSLAGVGLILLGSAYASAASIDLPAGTSPAEADALTVSSYQENYEVSKQIAEENLEAQEDGAGIVEQLEDSQGKRYAGVWFDNESGEFVVPAVASADRAKIAALLDGADLQGDFRTTPVPSSWDELEVAQKSIDSALLELIEEGLVGTSLDPRINAVVIEQAKGATKSQRAEIQAVAQRESVEVAVRDSEEPRLGISTQACQYGASVCDAPMRGGVDIVPSGLPRGTGCTAGFKGIGDAYGNRFVLTAGHCIVQSGALKWDSFTAAPEVRKDLGHADAYSFPTHDYAAINAGGTYWDKPSWPSQVAYWGVNQESPISYESSSYMGQWVCHVGQQSGLSCGTVNGMHMTGASEDEAGHILGYLVNLTRFTQICSIGGDSGGPVIAGNVALGIYSSSDKPSPSSPACYWNGYYTEITEDTDLLGVHVAPRIPPPPAAWHTDNLGGGTILGDPAISSSAPQLLDVFVRGLDNNLWQKWTRDGAAHWSIFVNLGTVAGAGPIASSPGAVSWGPNRVDIVARMTNGSVGRWYNDGTWHFQNIGGPPGGTIIGDPEIASTGVGHLNVFVRGEDGNLWQRWTTDGGASWSGWQNLSAMLGGSIASGPGVTSALPNSLTVVARRPDSTVGVWSWVNGAWNFQGLTGQILGDPDISSTGEGHVNIFAQGLDQQLWQKWTTGIGWSPWQLLPGGAIGSGPGAVSWSPTRVDTVARMPDGTVGHWYYAT